VLLVWTDTGTYPFAMASTRSMHLGVRNGSLIRSRNLDIAVTLGDSSCVCRRMTAVIEIEGLRKEYRRWRRPPRVAVNGLDLSVPEGGVFGFLGANGSGKTTTIRCLLGLVSKTAGSASVLGQGSPAGIASVMPKIGAIVETPAMFPSMTARENLDLFGAIDRIGPRRVEHSLATVGLLERADEPVAKYSLGMRQRLGLAAALLKDPALLVLDEPVNGLDPGGIREIRELLVRLGNEGRTVFLSSHLLSEVEQTCDRVAIIDDGRLLLSGRVDQVLADAARPSMLVGLDDTSSGRQILRRAGLTVEDQGQLLRVGAAPADGAHITRLLADAGLYVNELRADVVSLEELFLSLTNRENEEVAA
jgi:ABC-2 type transport system ATP-binding protein